MKTEQNNYAFIDSQNLNLGVQSLGWKLDHKRFRIYLRDKYNVSKAFLFIGYVPGNQFLYTSLQSAGYICVFKPTLKVNKNNAVKIKGNVDAELVLHTMIELPNYEKAVVVSGDGDFYCLFEYLAANKKLIKIIVPNLKYSSLIRKFSAYIVNIQNLKEKLELKFQKKKRHSLGTKPFGSPLIVIQLYYNTLITNVNLIRYLIANLSQKMKFSIKVKTNAKKNSVEKLDDDNFLVQVTTSPQKGKANDKIIELLADHFDIAKSRIQIIRGLTAKQKTIEIK